jgi:hypothetical protein
MEHAVITRRALAAAILAMAPAAALAHHGWRWAEDAEFTLEGVIRDVRLGNPHGLIEVEDADGALWTVELGQPWRHERAGLSDSALAPGVAILIEGHRSADPADLVVKAERVVVDGMRYNLYPDRS